MKTKSREIDDLSVPTDRERKYRTMVFVFYSESISVDELIISLYSKGILIRMAYEIVETIFQNRYSRSGPLNPGTSSHS